jgi:Tol biopolymer transport system component
MHAKLRQFPLRAAALLLLIALTACGRGNQPAATRSPQLLESFVFVTEDGATTRFWLADPAKPSVRQVISAVDHASGWSGVANLSPNGKLLALTVLPRNERDPDHGARLQILNIESRKLQSTAEGIDLRSTLVWAPDGGAVTFQRFEGSQQQLWSQPASGGAASKMESAAQGERLVPLAFNQISGQRMEVRFNAQGVDLQAGRTGASPELVQHLSDGSARDFALSPGGTRLAYLAVDNDQTPALSRAYVADIGKIAPSPLPSDWGEAVGVTWDDKGGLTIGSAGSRAALRTETGGRLPSPPIRGFMQPLSWSPSANYLAVRVFTGDSATQPGTARDELLTQRGKLVAITDILPVRFVGWTTAKTQNAAH